MSTADEAAAAFARDMGPTFCVGLDGAWVREHDGAAAMVTGCPAPTFNAVIAYRRGAVRPTAMLLDEVAATGHPYCLETRSDDDEVERLARARGMVVTERVPLMVLDDPVNLVAANDGVAIRTLGRDELDLHVDLVTEGFEAPPAIFERLRQCGVLYRDGVTAYVALDEGEPVATALGAVGGGFVGVFNVATPAPHRRRGYGAALTARTVLDGLAAGAHAALLQSSRMGMPVYERLGFRTVEHWTVWQEGPAA